MKLSAALFALLLGSTLVKVQANAVNPVNVLGYNCPPTCNDSPNCFCATNDVPGGYDAKDIPQFIVLTNDDAITVQTQPVVLGITEKHTNPNGCKIPATWFVSINYTDPDLVQEVYMKNHEIASHTYSHVMNPDVTEIVAAKLWLNQTAHVPMEKIKGFRAPYLVHNDAQRRILQQNGFLYDSSIPEPFPTPTSPAENKRVWPYTFDYGAPQRCDLGTGTCSVGESHPGLWEFPMWDIQDEFGKVVTNMDPQGNIFDVYKREFDRNYNGNRAPLGIYFHAAWLMTDQTRIDQLHQFIDYASSQKDVWFVTITQALQWIKNPVTADKYREVDPAKGCKAPTDMWFASGSFCKKIQCVNGNWSDVTCDCTCAAEFLPNQPGFCVDSTGACTVPKEYDESQKIFFCPGTPREAPQVSAASTKTPAKAVDPSCGHPLMSFTGLSMSGAMDNSALYSEAIKAIDGLCASCAVADDQRVIDGNEPTNFFMVKMGQPTEVTGVFLVAGKSADITIHAGDDDNNNGQNNPICASGVKVNAGTPTTVPCATKATIFTVKTTGTLSLCDIYLMFPGAPAIKTPGSESEEDPKPAAEASTTTQPAATTEPAASTQPAAAGTETAAPTNTELPPELAAAASNFLSAMSSGRRLLADKEFK